MSTDSERQKTFNLLVEKMAEMFEFPPETVTLRTHLFDDLALDSIDAIDLAVQLQDLTGHKVEEDSLRKLRTVSDVVDLVVMLQAKQSA